MSIKEQIKNKNKYFIFVSLIAIICMLGAIFGLTYAYIIGNVSDDTSSNMPFVQADIYYGTTKLTGGVELPSITGSISATGVVSLKINSTTLTANPGESINLPLYIKNSGNVDAELISLSMILTITNTSDGFEDNAIYGSNDYYLTFNTVENSGYTYLENMIFDYNDITLTKDSSSQTQFLSTISVDSNIASSSLCGTTFTINCQAEIGQIGIEDL